MATALQVGLIPGPALQDGDILAKLIGNTAGGGTFGLGTSVTSGGDLTNSGNNSVANAFQITSSITILSTVTTTGNSIQLPTIPATTMVRIYNQGANSARVFPPTGQQIDGAAANAAVFLSGAARCDYLYLGSGRWISDLLGTTSA